LAVVEYNLFIKPTKNRFADQETQVGLAGPYTAKII